MPFVAISVAVVIIHRCSFKHFSRNPFGMGAKVSRPDALPASKNTVDRYLTLLPTSKKHSARRKYRGYYQCRCCGHALYKASVASQNLDNKNERWPAFEKCFEDAVELRKNEKFGGMRWEIICKGCGEHVSGFLASLSFLIWAVCLALTKREYMILVCIFRCSWATFQRVLRTMALS